MYIYIGWTKLYYIVEPNQLYKHDLLNVKPRNGATFKKPDETLLVQYGVLVQ